jgi:hypothetical protein
MGGSNESIEQERKIRSLRPAYDGKGRLLYLRHQVQLVVQLNAFVEGGWLNEE